MSLKTNSLQEEDEFDKRKCTSCGTAKTSLWRRFQGNIVCNACGLYLKANGQKRPEWLQQRHRVARHQKSYSSDNPEMFMQWKNDDSNHSCSNCQATTSSLWRKNEQNLHVCNSCWLWKKTRGTNRPIEMKSDVIRRRKRLSATISKADLEQPAAPSPGMSISSQPPTGRRLHQPYPVKPHSSPVRHYDYRLEAGPSKSPHYNDSRTDKPTVFISSPTRPFDGYRSHFPSSPYAHYQHHPNRPDPKEPSQSILVSPYPAETTRRYSSSYPGTTISSFAGYSSPGSSSKSSGQEHSHEDAIESSYKDEYQREQSTSTSYYAVQPRESERSLPHSKDPQIPITPVASPSQTKAWEKPKNAMSLTNLLN